MSALSRPNCSAGWSSSDARRRAKSSPQGRAPQPGPGLSVEFADHRNYVLGDDLRFISTGISSAGSTIVPQIVRGGARAAGRIFLDASESMNFGTPSKFGSPAASPAAVGYGGPLRIRPRRGQRLPRAEVGNPPTSASQRAGFPRWPWKAPCAPSGQEILHAVLPKPHRAHRLGRR